MTRVWGCGVGGGVCSPYQRATPSDQIQRRQMHGSTRNPGGRARQRDFAGPGPGCGLGAACARAERWAEPAFAGFGPREEE